MNLSVNGFTNAGQFKMPSFTMAKFSPRGLVYAQSCSDIYEPLGTPNVFKNPEFYNKKGFFSKAPFTKYLENKLNVSKKSVSAPSQVNVEEVAQTIIECGATPNGYTNSMFIRQLVATKPSIDKLNDSTKTQIAAAIEEVLKANWNNPNITNDETKALVNLSRPVLSDKQYTVLCGVLQNALSKNS